MSDNDKTNEWDEKSKNESQINFVLASHMGNPNNNTNNPNWRNQMLKTGYRSSMLNDPQRVESRNAVEDNNSNKKLLKDYPINPS